MGNRNMFKVHVLVYLIANIKVCVWDFNYAWIIEMSNSQKDTYVNITHLYLFIQTIFIELLLGIQFTVSLERDIQRNH